MPCFPGGRFPHSHTVRDRRVADPAHHPGDTARILQTIPAEYGQSANVNGRDFDTLLDLRIRSGHNGYTADPRARVGEQCGPGRDETPHASQRSAASPPDRGADPSTAVSRTSSAPDQARFRYAAWAPLDIAAVDAAGSWSGSTLVYVVAISMILRTRFWLNTIILASVTAVTS